MIISFIQMTKDIDILPLFKASSNLLIIIITTIVNLIPGMYFLIRSWGWINDDTVIMTEWAYTQSGI